MEIVIEIINAGWRWVGPVFLMAADVANVFVVMDLFRDRKTLRKAALTRRYNRHA